VRKLATLRTINSAHLRKVRLPGFLLRPTGSGLSNPLPVASEPILARKKHCQKRSSLTGSALYWACIDSPVMSPTTSWLSVDLAEWRLQLVVVFFLA
jgi:hypothetical protein